MNLKPTSIDEKIAISEGLFLKFYFTASELEFKKKEAIREQVTRPILLVFHIIIYNCKRWYWLNLFFFSPEILVSPVPEDSVDPR